MTPVEEVATLLHEFYCGLDHTEMCDWLYGSWENQRYAQQKYLKWAHALLHLTMTEYMVGYQAVVGTLKAMQDSREALHQ